MPRDRCRIWYIKHCYLWSSKCMGINIFILILVPLIQADVSNLTYPNIFVKANLLLVNIIPVLAYDILQADAFTPLKSNLGKLILGFTATGSSTSWSHLNIRSSVVYASEIPTLWLWYGYSRLYIRNEFINSIIVHCKQALYYFHQYRKCKLSNIYCCKYYIMFSMLGTMNLPYTNIWNYPFYIFTIFI